MRLFSRRHVVSTPPGPAASQSATTHSQVDRAPVHRAAAHPATATRVPTMAAKTPVESPSSRRFGELLVEDAVITQEQLDAALRLQTVARVYVPIGQVLLMNKLITRKKLNALLNRHGKRSRLGAILVKAGRITVAQLEEALAHRARMPLGRALITLGYLDEIAMRDALCTQLHVNFFDLDKIAVDQTLAAIISQRFAARHLVLPLFRVGDILVVAVDDPSQAAVIEELERHLGMQVEIVTTTTAKLMAAIKRLYGPPLPPMDLFARRNILMGPVRDFVVAELASRALNCVSVPF
jgi:Type II secretion system (T2SS), protein E, N-terminal domain